MASLSFTITTTTALSSSLSFSKTSPHRRFNTPTKQTHRFKVSCNVEADDHAKPIPPNPQTPKLILPKTSLDMQNVDRRNLLLGLGGLYGTVNLTTLPSAFAYPIQSPSDISKCVDANVGFDAKNAVRTKACCPPVPQKAIKDFVFPQGKIRTRPAAHRASPEYVAKYKDAIEAMKCLPSDHPHSYVQQAKIHCAYCNGGYTQVESGFPDKELQIHNSWLFFPFHRWYLYFFERILAKLINDPTFALPYWNWDNPMGMSMPAMMVEGGKNVNSLFDVYRNATHLPPAVVDLDYNDSDRDCLHQISNNLGLMHKQMIRNARDWESFFGGAYKAGSDPVANNDASVGSIEAGCHTAVHLWVGDPHMPNHEDLGNFYSAGYDPLFYVHHANVDRMWTLWKRVQRKGHKEPKDPDWRYASYVFYDENGEMVRVYNKDCLRVEDLKYEYEMSDTPWLKRRYCRPRKKKSGIASRSVGKVTAVEEVTFPVKLDRIVKVLVKRPATNRSAEDKEDEVEILMVNGIKFDSEKFVKFDVYVNDEDDVPASTAADSEFAGSFAQIPHNHGGTMLMTSAARFGLTELLEDIEAEDDESVLVTLVPRRGCEEVTVSEIKIKLVPTE